MDNDASELGTRHPEDLDGALLYPIIFFFVGTLTALDLWSAFQPSEWNWGFHFLAFYPVEIRIAIPLLMLLTLVPAVEFFIIDLIRSLVKLLNDRSIILRWILALLGLAGIGFVFIYFRVETFFLGDGYLQIRSLKLAENAESLNLTGFAREPFVGVLIFQLSHLLDFLDITTTPEEAYLWLSLVSGLFFAVIAWKGVRLFVSDEADRVLLFLFLMASGVNQLFCGYVENYAPGYIGMLLFLFLSVGYLQERYSIYWPFVAFGILLPLNFGAIVFVPALIFIAIIGIRRDEFVNTFAALVLSGIGFAVLLLISGYTPLFFYQVFGETRSNILSVSGPLDKHQAFHIFSLTHLSEIVNLFLLSTPAAVALLTAAIVLTLKKKKAVRLEIWFLLLAMVCGIILISVVNSELGMSRDWDIAAPFTVGIPLAAIALWMGIVDDRELRQRILLILGLVSLLQTGAWITLNADEQRAVTRFEILEDKRLWGVQACLDAYEELAIYHRDRHEYLQSAACYEQYLALDSTNDRVRLSYAKIEQTAGNLDKSIEAYKTLVRNGSAGSELLAPLGVLLARSGRFDEAFSYLQQAEKQTPGSAKIKNDIGALFANKKEFSRALPYFLDAIRLDENFQGGYLNAAACYDQMGESAKAQQYREMARRK